MSARGSPASTSTESRRTQRIRSCGGAYIVAHENFGETPGLVAAASLLIDYVLTLALSVSAGMLASFTLSQSGMVRHWLRSREPCWQRSAVINAIGAVLTALSS